MKLAAIVTVYRKYSHAQHIVDRFLEGYGWKSPLVNCMEQMFLSGKPPYPIERTLLTTGLTAAGVDSLYNGQARLKTPHLQIQYQPSAASTFWRS
jgi:hypothetical protein